MLSLLLAAVTAQDCVESGNLSGFYNMNPSCNYAGTCIKSDFAVNLGMDFGSCKCCDPYDTSGDAICSVAGGWNLGTFSNGLGDCTRFSTRVSAVLSYVLHLHHAHIENGVAGAENGLFGCNTGTDGVGVEYDEANLSNGYQSIPDMIPLSTTLMMNAESYSALASQGYKNYVGIYTPFIPFTFDPSATFPTNQHCRVCLAAPNNCRVDVNGVIHDFASDELHDHAADIDAEGHLLVTFGSDLNTYYNHSCAKANNLIPTNNIGHTENPGCVDYNPDHGEAAEKNFQQAAFGDDEAVTHQAVFHDLARQPTSTPVGTTDYPAVGLGWDVDISIELFAFATHSYDTMGGTVFALPTLSPSTPPTPSPTESPTMGVDDCFSLGYTHTKEDLTYLGVTSGDCRGGLDASWPGGASTNMCDSPYVICLPQENTPNVGFPLADGTTDMYLDNSTPYSLEQCKKECAYDQRCTGFEFWATTTGQTGFCSLIDDIPVVMGTAAGTNPATGNDLLGVSDWNGIGRICYEKTNACHPYFRQDQLDDVMLKCYCPNNRKGFYTKKVTRTVGATHFCGYDAQDGDSVTQRIKEAQANRMFHLCENWCLFNTQSPRTESWYHDPWNPSGPCWREQYAGVGTHRSYCYRVIRDPFTIEQFFIDQRSAKMCTSGVNNTPTPVYMQDAPAGDIDYKVALPGDTCADKCAAEGLSCSEDVNDLTYGGSNDVAAQAAFLEAGYDCSSTFTEGNLGWAFPGRKTDGTCILRNTGNDSASPPLDNTCNMSIGANYMRLCSCYGAP